MGSIPDRTLERVERASSERPDAVEYSNGSVLELVREVKALRARVAELEAFARDVRDNWDCDSDGHRYDTGCRCCKAAELVTPRDLAPPPPA
jgi:N6-adenosine-specific RNA methylase IME4